MAVTVIRECDRCGSKSAAEVTLTLALTLPAAEKGRKASHEKHTVFPLGDLCVVCTDRHAIAVGNLIAEIKLGAVQLPEPAPADQDEAQGDSSAIDPAEPTAVEAPEQEAMLPLGDVTEAAGNGQDVVPAETANASRRRERRGHPVAS